MLRPGEGRRGEGRGRREASWAGCTRPAWAWQRTRRKALAWHRKAAENGSSLAMLDVAVALSMGRGVTANESEAFGWYRRAAAKNNANAQFIVGQTYAEGRPWVTKNRRYARRR